MRQGSPAWQTAFVLSLITCGLSFAVLAAALLNEFGESSGALDNAGGPLLPGATRTAQPTEELLFAGPLPAGFEDMGFVTAGTRSPDVAFTPSLGPGDGIAVRTFVPVTSYTSGILNVTRAEFDRLVAGTVPFAALGGYGDEPLFAVVSADLPLVAQMVTSPAPPRVFESYASLRAAMANVADGPFVALVPLEQLGPEMAVLSLDGIDPLLAPDLAAWPFVERVSVEALTGDGEEALPGIEGRLFRARPVVTRIVATGDILMVRCSLDRIRATGDWGAPFRGPVGGFLAAADLALGSLDSSIQDIGEPYGCVETTNLTAPAEAVAALTVAGFDEVTLATNHAADCGDGFCSLDALTRTVEIVSAAGIKVVGAGVNLDAALTPAIFDVNGVSVGVLGFDDIAAENIGATATEPGTAPLDDSYDDENSELPDAAAFYGRAETLSLTRFTDAIRRLKEQVDVVVVQVQSGYEDTHDPSPRSVKALRAAAEAGADLVIGNQAHWAGAIEVRSGVFITYALGNFVFDQLHTPEHSEGYLAEAILLDGKVATVRLHPYRIEDQHRPEFAGTELRAKILDDVFTASELMAATWP